MVDSSQQILTNPFENIEAHLDIKHLLKKNPLDYMLLQGFYVG
jgi:hypothetical protein